MLIAGWIGGLVFQVGALALLVRLPGRERWLGAWRCNLAILVLLILRQGSMLVAGDSPSGAPWADVFGEIAIVLISLLYCVALIWLRPRIQSILREEASVRNSRSEFRRVAQKQDTELRQRRQAYEDIFNVIMEGLMVTDESGVVVEVNEAACRMHGRTRKEMLGLQARTLVAEDESDLFALFMQDSGDAGSFVCTSQGLCKDGRCIPLRVRGRRFQYLGAPHLLVILEDTTERDEAMAALEQSERRYRLLADNVADVIWTLNDQGRFTYVSPSIEQLRGLTPEEAMQESLEDSLLPESYARVMALRKQRMRGEIQDPVCVQVEQPCKDGSTVWVEVMTQVWYGADGAPDGVLGVSRDITRRREAERRLRASEERLRLALHVSKAFVFEAVPFQDDLGLVRLAISHVTGTPIEQLPHDRELYDWIVEHIHPDQRARIVAAAEDFFAGQSEMFSEEFYLQDASGAWLSIRHVATAIEREEDGAVSRMVGVWQDISEQEQLRQRVQQAEKMEAVGQLAGGVAHDFNNQIGGILGYAEMLSKMVEGDKEQRFVRGIVICAERAADLTEQLLAFSRRRTLAREPVNLQDLVREVIGLLMHSIDRRIEIECDLGGELPLVVGDASALQNAILNVGLNARDAMTDGGRLSFVLSEQRLKEEDARVQEDGLTAGAYVSLRVRDTGCGIPAAVLPHIFEPFYTTKERGKGTGMGLASAYGTLQAHQGLLRVESVPGQGTCVGIYLPVATGVESSGVESSGVGAGEDVDFKQRLAGYTILVVDDEEQIRTMVKSMLEEAGSHVLTAEDGARGVEVFREHLDEVDLIVLDLMMPVMSGEEAFEELRALEAEIPVVIGSGYSMSGLTSAVLSKPNVSFVRKPCRMNELIQAVGAALFQE